jgi:hypothetical protein
MLKRWSKNIGAVMALLLVSGLLLVVIMVGAMLIQSSSISILNTAEWTNQHPVQAGFTASTIMNIYYLVSGIIFLAFFFLMEYMLVTTGVPKELVLRRTSLTLGIELLILSLLQLAMLAYTPFLPLQVGLSSVEIVLGIWLIYLGRRKAPVSS